MSVTEVQCHGKRVDISYRRLVSLIGASAAQIHGEFRTGKTQLCHTVRVTASSASCSKLQTSLSRLGCILQLCVTTQLPRSQGGGAGAKHSHCALVNSAPRLT